MKSLLISLKYSLLIYSRIRIALFFSIIFPVLLLVIFGSIWGISDAQYLFYLISGITGMNVISQGVYSTGAVIKQYYQLQTIKFLKSLPLNIAVYLTGLVLCRAIVVCISILVLALLAFVFFGYAISFSSLMLLFFGSVIGILCFSFMGLLISFFGSFKPEKDSSTEIGNLAYFLMVFLCDTFFPISETNAIVAFIGKLFPLTYLLNFFRQQDTWISLAILLAFTLVFSLAFFALFNHKQVERI